MCGCGVSTYQTPGSGSMDCGCGCGGLKKSDWFKAKYSLQSAVIFFLIANPEMFKVVRNIFGGWVASESGLPSQAGVFLHALVYALIVFVLMKITLPSPY